MAPGGVLVICSLSALAREGQATRIKAAQRASSEREAISGPRQEDELAHSLPQCYLTVLKNVSPLRTLASGFPLITVAGEDGEAGILGEARIAEGEVTEDEDGAASRFDAAGMKAIGTKASAQGAMRLLLRIRHESKDSAVCGRGDC